MDTHSQKFKIRLGLFVAGGLALFVNPVFKITSTFHNVGGLQIGNNVRFSGINVGTVDNIVIINDSTVRTDLIVKAEVRQFIKSDCTVAIGSEGVIGDKLITISQGSANAPLVKEGQRLVSIEPVETDAIMASLRVTAGNAEVITQQLAEIMTKINSGGGTLGRLIQDKTLAENLNNTVLNLKKSSKSLDENMTAAKHNFLFKGYFDRKAKKEALKKENAKKAVDVKSKKTE